MTSSDAVDVSAGEVAERVDELLAELTAAGDPRAAAAADELTRCLVRLYGAGLARIVTAIGPERTAELAADPLVESLLLIHDLHPLDVDDRVRRAVTASWPGSGELEYLGRDADGVVHLRLAGAAGCQGSRSAALQAVERAVTLAAPEVTEVEVAIPPPPPPLLQVTTRPGLGRVGASQ
jgi:hypothetical protein